MQEQLVITSDQMTVWTWLVRKGVGRAIAGLSTMVGEDIQVDSLELKEYALRDIPEMMGGAGNTVVGIYLAIGGDSTGHFVVIYAPSVAFQLVDIQMQQPLGTTVSLDSMRYSALSEIGNIMGSFFLNALSNATGLVLTPSPPAVMVDMVGAVLDVALTNLCYEGDSALVARSNFGTEGRKINGTFIIMPSHEFMKTMVTKL